MRTPGDPRDDGSGGFKVRIVDRVDAGDRAQVRRGSWSTSAAAEHRRVTPRPSESGGVEPRPTRRGSPTAQLASPSYDCVVCVAQHANGGVVGAPDHRPGRAREAGVGHAGAGLCERGRRVPRRGPGGRGARARRGGRGHRRARRPPRHGRSADPKRIPLRDRVPAPDRCPSSVPDLGRRGAISAGAARPDGRSGQRAASLARSQPTWAETGRKRSLRPGLHQPRNPWKQANSGNVQSPVSKRVTAPTGSHNQGLCGSRRTVGRGAQRGGGGL